MMDASELLFLGRYNGNQQGPIGTYWLPRTNAYQQLASDGLLPQAGTWILISTSASLTTAQIATAINTVLSTSYVAGSFHSYSAGSDAIGFPGTGADDA
ncbi:MAG TPA: hypothetical protein VL485_24140 [Ktedonobacteraceae bacterium]|nr:hypothetical protein [Ktedonobacteraceae bacterium]